MFERSTVLCHADRLRETELQKGGEEARGTLGRLHGARSPRFPERRCHSKGGVGASATALHVSEHCSDRRLKKIRNRHLQPVRVLRRTVEAPEQKRRVINALLATSKKVRARVRMPCACACLYGHKLTRVEPQSGQTAREFAWASSKNA